MKHTTYSDCWKQTATTQQRFMSALDTKKGQFQLAFLEPTILVPKSAEDNKASVFSFDTKRSMQLIKLICINRKVK